MARLRSTMRMYGPAALRAFRAKYGLTNRAPRYDWRYEHGQLWIIGAHGDQYSVVDAEGVGTVDGFDFEQVSEKDEAYQ